MMEGDAPGRMQNDLDTLQKLMNELEFENRQYEIEIEREMQITADLEAKTEAAKQGLKLNEKAIKQLKEEEEMAIAQSRQNMQNCDSIQEACNILGEREKGLLKTLEELKRKSESTRDRHQSTVSRYNLVYANHEKKYKEGKPWMALRRKQEEVEQLEQEYLAEKRKTQELAEKLEKAKCASAENATEFSVFRNQTDFIVKLAEMKVAYDASVAELESNTKSCEELKATIKKKKEIKYQRDALEFERKKEAEKRKKQEEQIRWGSRRIEEEWKDPEKKQAKDYKLSFEENKLKSDNFLQKISIRNRNEETNQSRSEVSPAASRFHTRAPPQILLPARQLSVSAQKQEPRKSTETIFKVPMVPPIVGMTVSAGRYGNQNAVRGTSDVRNSAETEERISSSAQKVDLSSGRYVPSFLEKCSSRAESYQSSNIQGQLDDIAAANDLEMRPMSVDEQGHQNTTSIRIQGSTLTPGDLSRTSQHRLADTSQEDVCAASQQNSGRICEAETLPEPAIQDSDVVGSNLDSNRMSSAADGTGDHPAASASSSSKDIEDGATTFLIEQHNTPYATTHDWIPGAPQSAESEVSDAEPATDDASFRYNPNDMEIGIASSNHLHPDFTAEEYEKSICGQTESEEFMEIPASGETQVEIATVDDGSTGYQFNFEKEMAKLKELSKSPGILWTGRRMFPADDDQPGVATTTATEVSLDRSGSTKPSEDLDQLESSDLRFDPTSFNFDRILGFRSFEPATACSDVFSLFGKGSGSSDTNTSKSGQEITGKGAKSEHLDDIFDMFRSKGSDSSGTRAEKSDDGVFKMFGDGEGDIGRSRGKTSETSDAFSLFNIGVPKGGTSGKESSSFFGDFGAKSSGGQTKSGRFSLF